MDALDIEATRRRLEQAGGGYEIVHESPGLEIGVYVLVAPEPDRQQPHVDDEVYVVLEGRGVLEVEGEQIEVSEGKAAFVPAGADHRFTGYEGLSVLVVFSRPHDAGCSSPGLDAAALRGRRDAHSRVDDDASARPRDHRVEVELGHLGQVLAELREPVEEVGQCGRVGRRGSAVARDEEPGLLLAAGAPPRRRR